ncbi:MAG: esterase family protein [Oscillospiraceae bacterium]|jgi:S-formylglutathione hydrolase FrmB|nr:esterase family protein [Oscillospiraceae bacterium]
MALMRLDFFSEVLGQQTYVNVLLPQNTTGEGRGWQAASFNPPFPVLYLLHGLSDNQDMWLRNTSIERYTAGRNLAVVMPTTDRGFYTDTTYGLKHFTYISEELPSLLKQYLPLSERREDNYAAGLSMGGYGAFKLALRNPERFSFAASLSGALMTEEMIKMEGIHNPKLRREMSTVFGETLKPEDDIFRLLETASPKPKLFVCCGMKDWLFPVSAAMREHALKLGYDITWQADEQYDHEWGYWDLMIQKVLDMLPGQTKPAQRG